MKNFTYFLSVVAFLLISYNFTQINWDQPFQGDSVIAIITIMAGLCTIVILAILRTSKKIEKTIKQKKK